MQPGSIAGLHGRTVVPLQLALPREPMIIDFVCFRWQSYNKKKGDKQWAEKC